MLTATFDLTEFHRKVKSSANAIENDTMIAVAKAAKAGAEKAKQGGFKDKSGNLRRGIMARVVGWSGNTYVWEFKTSNAPYALFVEEPTKPHWIFPKAGYNAPLAGLYPGQSRRGRGAGPHEHVVGRGHSLRWKGANGESIFRRSAYHPGTEGFFFMRDAERHAQNVLIQTLHGGFHNLEAIWRPN